MLNYKQIWHEIKPIRWLNKFNLTIPCMKTLLFSMRWIALSFNKDCKAKLLSPLTKKRQERDGICMASLPSVALIRATNIIGKLYI